MAYGAPLNVLREALGEGRWRKGGSVTPLTAGEWRGLAGAMNGVPVLLTEVSARDEG